MGGENREEGGRRFGRLEDGSDGIHGEVCCELMILSWEGEDDGEDRVDKKERKNLGMSC